VTTVLKYENLTVDDVTENLKNQVCTNILALSPGGICEVLGVFPGSVNILVRVVYPDANQATELALTLEDDTPETQQILIESFPEGTTVTVTEVEEQLTPQEPLPTLSPSNVQATSSPLCTPSLDVTWSPPTGNTAQIVSYIVECVQSGGPGTSVVVKAPTTKANLNVASQTPYTCRVSSISTQGTSPAVSGSTATYTYVYIIIMILFLSIVYIHHDLAVLCCLQVPHKVSPWCPCKCANQLCPINLTRQQERYLEPSKQPR